MPAATFLRGAAFLYLSDIGHIVSGSAVSDDGGGGTVVWTAGTASIPCRIDPIGGNEALIAGAISDTTTHLISVPPGLGMDDTYRFAIDGRGTFALTAWRERTGEPLTLLEAVQL